MKALNTEEVDEIVHKFKELGVEAIAISLIHGYKNPIHEQQLKEAILKFGLKCISHFQVKRLKNTVSMKEQTQQSLILM